MTEPRTTAGTTDDDGTGRPAGRVLAVDPGTVRIGLALSDPLRITASPLAVIAADADAVDRIVELAREHDVATVVVGLPTGLGGGEGESARRARELADRLADRLDVEVVLHDERFTSRIAEAAMLEAGSRRRTRRENVDKVAAAVLLRSYLEAGSAKGRTP